MHLDEPTRLLSELERLLAKDDWEDYKQISALFTQIGEFDLQGEQYARYIFLLQQF